MTINGVYTDKNFASDVIRAQLEIAKSKDVKNNGAS